MPSLNDPLSTVNASTGPKPETGGESGAAAEAAILAHINDPSGAHAASAISYAGGGSWADGTTNPATDVESQLDKILSDLGTGTGAAKIHYGGSGGNTWADATAPGAGTLGNTVASGIVGTLGSTAATDGATKVGVHIITNTSFSIASGTLRSVLTALSLASNNQYTTDGTTFLGGSALPNATVQATLDTIVTTYNSQTASSSGARRIGIEARTNWLDGTTNVATNIFSSVDKIVTDLALQTTNLSGAQKIGVDALSNWLDGTTNPATNVASALKKIITDLNDNVGTGACGATRIGFAPIGNLSSTNVEGAISELDSEKAGLTLNNSMSGNNTFTGTNLFSNQVTANGASGDTNAAIVTTSTPTNFKLLWKMQLNATPIFIRFYLSPFAFLIVTGASWTGTQWTADANGNTNKYSFGDNATWVLQNKSATVGVPWNDSAWDTTQTLTVQTLQWTGNGLQTSYIAIEGRSDGTNNLGVGCNFRRIFSNTPSSFTFHSLSNSNVNTGPFDFANSVYGTGMFITPTGAGQVYWYGTVDAS